MNLLNFIPSVLAIAGFSAGVAFAAPVPTPVSGDVLIGFRAADGAGAAVSYLINVGSDTTFRNVAEGTVIEISGLGNIVADLTATYGANWHTRNDLYWGAFGSRISVNSSAYASRARIGGQPATVWPVLTQNARNATAQTIVDVVLGVGGYDRSDATANSPVATFQQNSGSESSYSKQVATPGTSDFGSLSQWTSIETNFANGAAGSALDFFRLAGAGNTFLGTFTISAEGVIRFAAPSTETNDDSDGDGFPDAVEVIAGTNPADSSSFPRAIVSVVENGIRIQSAVAAPNQTYTLEYTPSLSSGTWTVVATHSTGAGGSVLDFTDTDVARRANGAGFYRVRYGS